jgi:hypothetical protein
VRPVQGDPSLVGKRPEGARQLEPEPMLPATCEATRGFGFRGDYALRHALPLRLSPPIGMAC